MRPQSSTADVILIKAMVAEYMMVILGGVFSS